ncbi:MAG: hypothetical protein EOO89_22330, partial [Pedobacter sp.]
NEILLLKLQYAHLPGAIDLEALTTRFLKNQSHMQRDAKLNMAYAYLRQQLQEIHLKAKVINLKALMTATIKKYQISVQDLMTYKSIYQILFIANEYAAIQQNYGLIEHYIDRASQYIQDGANNKQPYLFYHLSILYYLSNFHLRRREFEKSKSQLKEMKELMETDSRYSSVFYMRYQLLCALNLYFTDEAPEAIELLQTSLKHKKAVAKAEDIEDLQLCITMFLALRNDRGSLKQLSLLTRADAWYEKKMGMLWTIRKNLMEILVHAQFSNIELAMSRLSSFRRRYKKYLLSTSEERVLEYLKLVEQYLTKPEQVFEAKYKKAVLDLLGRIENNDIFTSSFIAWLMARWEKKTAYEVVLTLLN